MSKKQTSASTGIGFETALLLIFITLKLCHVIDWSWWWVVSPLWIAILLAMVFLLSYILILTIVGILLHKKK